MVFETRNDQVDVYVHKIAWDFNASFHLFKQIIWMPITECTVKFWCNSTLGNALSSSKIFLIEVVVKSDPCANFFISSTPPLPGFPESLTPTPARISRIPSVVEGVCGFFLNPFLKNACSSLVIGGNWPLLKI